MKKVLCLLLSLALAFSLCSCGGETSSSGKSGGEKGSSSESKNNQSEPKEEPKSSAETVSEQVLLDESDIIITAKGLDKEELFGVELDLLIENNSEKNLTVQVRSVSVNGYMVETMFSADVAAGKKTNDAITFLRSDFEICGIETIADMEFSFHIFDDDWEAYLDTETIRVETSAASSYSYSFDDSGEELYNENGIRVVSRGISQDDSIFGPSLIVFIENTSDQDITVQTRNTSVNGFMIDPIFSEEVSAGKHAISGVTFMNSYLEDNDIEEIEEIELSFHIFETDGWDTIVDTAPITVTQK